MQIRILLAGTVFLLLSACAHAGNERRDADCSLGVDADKLASTEALIVARDQMREPADLFPVGAGKACALLVFDVNEDGRPENIMVKRVHPSRVYSDSAKNPYLDLNFFVRKRRVF